MAQRYGLTCGYRGALDTIKADKLCAVIDQTDGGDDVDDAFTALFALDPAGSIYSFHDTNVSINPSLSVVGVNGCTT
ncbi:MAG: hypothetical protein ACRYG8_08230 [Janthinobacterium lividum]